MLRRLKWRGAASCVAKPGAEPQTIVKEVGHLPCSHAGEKAITAERLADFEGIPFIDANVSTELAVESCRAKRLDARAVEKQMPAMKLFRRANQRERRASQLCRSAVRVGDKHRWQFVVRSKTYTRS